MLPAAVRHEIVHQLGAALVDAWRQRHQADPRVHHDDVQDRDVDQDGRPDHDHRLNAAS